MAAARSSTTVTFAAVTYTATSASVRKSRDQVDVTSLNDNQRQYIVSPLFGTSEVQLEFLGYGPRAGNSGSLVAAGVSAVGTVVSSSTTFRVNEPIRSQATIQFTS